MSPPAATSRPPAATCASAEERLALIEALDEAPDAVECARRSVEWLARHAGGELALCALVDAGGTRLVRVAARGVDPGAPALVLDIATSEADALAARLRSLARGECAVVGASEPRPGALADLLGTRDALLAPLRGARDALLGVLVAAPATAELVATAPWVARRLELALARHEAWAAEPEGGDPRSQFLASVSHEIRTPLNAVLGFTSMLLQGVAGPLAPRQAQMLARVDSNGRHLLALINDLLDIARLDVHRMPVHVLEFRVAELVAEVAGEIEPLVTRAGLALSTHVAPEVRTLRSDRRKIKQVLLNLLSNAIKFTPHGSVRIECTHVPARDAVAIAVRDSGVGIPEAHQRRIFDDFAQVVPGQHGGAGLGLSICRRIAALLGGEITLESRPGEGSTFTLVVPQASGRASERAGTSDKEGVATG